MKIPGALPAPGLPGGGWSLLAQALADPASMARHTAPQWDLLLRQAAAAGLAGRLGALAAESGILEQFPAPARRTLRSWLTMAEQQRRAVHWELLHLARDLQALPGPVLLLKGAAYAAAGLPNAAGRLCSDIDLMVARDQLDAAEAALLLGGWAPARMSPYDLRYYRRWMHELPPMTHIRRQTVLDVHHHILPPTARLKPRPEPILNDAQALPSQPRFAVPAPVDLVLHSATHRFHEGDWGHGLRDLVDLDVLLRHFSSVQPDFWAALLARAAQQGLGRPLHYGLHHAHRVLGTPVPREVRAACPDRPGRWLGALMHASFDAGLRSIHRSVRAPGSDAALAFLYLRSHALRMPPSLLLPHLARKAWQGAIGERIAEARERRAAAVRDRH